MTCDSGSRPTGRDVKQARGEARQSGGATSAASPNLQGEDTVEELRVMREALEAIANGRINTDFVMSDPPDWHSAFSQIQAIAKTALSKVSPLA